MDSTTQLEKAVSWPAEVALFEKYNGSLAGFCRSRGLSEVSYGNLGRAKPFRFRRLFQ